MTSLWRALALVWLGGAAASPGLADDPCSPESLSRDGRARIAAECADARRAFSACAGLLKAADRSDAAVVRAVADGGGPERCLRLLRERRDAAAAAGQWPALAEAERLIRRIRTIFGLRGPGEPPWFGGGPLCS